MKDALQEDVGDHSHLLSLLADKNEKVRLLTVKNIGKLKSIHYLDALYGVVNTDESTIVWREAVSSIGRMRHKDAIPYLFNILKVEDPKIACQAIRALLVFKGTEEVDSALRALKESENEMIRTIIKKAYYNIEDVKTKKDVLSHSQTYQYLKNKVINGDVRDVLKIIPDDALHLTFTSPPYYNARDYSIYPSYDAYLRFLKEVFLETHRITKEGRFLIVNTSPIIIPRISRSHSSKRYPIPFDLNTILVNTGWDFIDDIVWMKPEYSVKARIGGFLQHRNPLAYKPNAITEYLLVYRKHTDKLLDWNIKQYTDSIIKMSKVEDGFESTNVWQICPKSDKIHSAVFPSELCKRIISYYSFKGDLVFDPFAGSGTVGRVARMMGRLFLLTEKEERYFKYMQSSFEPSSLFIEDEVEFLTLDEFRERPITD